MEEQTVTEEITSPASEPEANQTEPQEQQEAGQPEATQEKAAEERPSRSHERIRETIAAKKEAERLAQEKSQEADYWKAQALANQPQQTQEIPGVDEDGIDPVKFAQYVIEQSRKENQTVAQQSKANEKFSQELAEVRSDPVMKSVVAQRAVSRIINSEGISPIEALAVYKEEQEELKRELTVEVKNRDEAGKFVRNETSSPSAGRGSSSAGITPFTRGQVASMSLDEYAKNREEINRQMEAGLIK